MIKLKQLISQEDTKLQTSKIVKLFYNTMVQAKNQMTGVLQTLKGYQHIDSYNISIRYSAKHYQNPNYCILVKIAFDKTNTQKQLMQLINRLSVFNIFSIE